MPRVSATRLRNRARAEVSRRCASIARRIARLEEALSPKSRPLVHHSLHVRFGNLRRLPEGDQRERHIEVVQCLPERNGQEWVEFAEVPGPEPRLPRQDPQLPKYLDLVFVEPRPPAFMIAKLASNQINLTPSSGSSR
jgi:hypothetical protein